ncbi:MULTISPECIES: flagellar motor switch protein FliN [Thalassolituus]|jgi:flagellar motor switch protein FliN/FliY|uniref:flagellar motor switch protein FliN n=2 Tax=Oceanospirillaceae TaxID=135620 RepID=UPI0007CF9DF2|nr:MULTISPECIES: flagellar motor switch protein FliN [Thalassolituus]KZY97294.1 flagellar motor switch protein [Oleibacter sp. HI0075]MAX87809.1 flagellar motor switch protein FliN [Oceanospirillaceae bacterium]MEC9256674.1 flagellar motor switch protein FliN [Pseudomonadota bacterium]HCG79389.1 flagellar motor switch protein FliN [Oceanospirillales bacterium]MEE3161303.1 flagellar motor switch protein FliN [Pseudomonadota bacterium]|tara:strand:+ start:159 stop:695 length:537 start_codon:yes stop_codon:yes gene_type:complete
MSDEKDQDQSPEEELDPQKLADEVAGGIEEASGEESAAEGEEDDQALADEWAAAMEEAGETDEEEPEPEPDPVKQIELDELQDEGRPGGNGDNPELEVILDIPVRISMEVGATKIPIRNLLQLNQGSVVELDRLAGEPLDVLVNGTLIAHGEVVMVNDKFGIRLTDVVSQSERIHRLR